MKNMLALSQERFSARKFTSEAVSQEDVDYIMRVCHKSVTHLFLFFAFSQIRNL